MPPDSSPRDPQQDAGPSTRFKRIFARIHIWLYRRTGGWIGYRLGPAHVLLLATIGQKTGLPRVTPITFFQDGTDFVLVASNYGADRDPIWWRNLQRHPEATVQVRRRAIAVRAHAAQGEERDRLVPLALQLNPTYAQYLRRTQRDIPLVVLTPI